MTRTIAVEAQAKVNLVLEVLERHDTHHDILSIAQTISLHDMLTFSSRAISRLLLRAILSSRPPIC